LKNLKSKFIRGFTMIELLIVIAVLGILAVAVLATINPLEQINRGRDTGSRGDAEQLLSAIDRFNATQAIFPWQADRDDESMDLSTLVEVTDVQDADGCLMLDKLAQGGGTCSSSADEIKAAFANRLRATSYNPLYIEYEAGLGDSIYICFQPQSKAFLMESVERCSEDVPDDFPDVCAGCDEDHPDSCWICLP